MRLPSSSGVPTPSQDGFTLIEALLAMAVIAIVAALAYPAYKHAVIKSKRAEAKAVLMQLMQQQERYFTQNTTYVVFSSESLDMEARRFKWYSGERPENSAYEISGGACAGETIQNCVKLTARPGTAKVDKAFSDTACGELALTSTGVKSASGGDTLCW